jgi:hypothetical protein
MNQTNYWICDKCGRKIDNVNDGWVEWLTPTTDNFPERNNFGIRIVHSTDCLYTDRECDNHKAIPGDARLKDFTGADGLMDLLRFISDDAFKDKEEVLEIIKRIHIPGYEEARKHIDAAIAYGAYEPNTKEDYCSQHDIENILNFAAKNKDI